MIKFELSLSLNWDREHNIRVKGGAEPYVPARTNCSNDDACPAEGGDIEVYEVWLQQGSKPAGTFRERKLSADTVSRLSDRDDFIAVVEEALNDYWEDDGPDCDDREDD